MNLLLSPSSVILALKPICESESDEESTTVGDATTDMADTMAASDDDDDSNDEESDEEEAKNEPEKVETPVKKVE